MEWTGPPASARKLALEVRRTPDLKLRFVGFIRFVSFNFGQVQLLRFIVVVGFFIRKLFQSTRLYIEGILNGRPALCAW